MLRNLFLILCPLLFAVLAAPVAQIAAKAGQSDVSNIYVVIETPLKRSLSLAAVGARDIGPQSAPFARMMYADPAAHAQLLDHGYWVIPASSLAALCGVSETVLEA